jgi:hypothetical protein
MKFLDSKLNSKTINLSKTERERERMREHEMEVRDATMGGELNRICVPF